MAGCQNKHTFDELGVQCSSCGSSSLLSNASTSQNTKEMEVMQRHCRADAKSMHRSYAINIKEYEKVTKSILKIR
ncbi:hypothetical protein RND71_015693 [Anisodus tanguticus]|uniref:Uncharacterized protein n=1 Tax=Anisodus tanguticus TaxID=243964 RepID=A0AAE1S6B6_9SOLA|nr:hypothetical protein RND71_015693 [Anisodus tanguticus]